MRMTHRLTVLHICAMLFENTSKDYKDIDWTRKRLYCLSVSLTFEQETWVLHMTRRLTVLHICVKLFENPSKDYKDRDWTQCFTV